MNIGISSMLAMPGNLFDFLKYIEKSNFKKVEIRLRKSHWDFDMVENINKIKKYKIKINSIHSPMNACISSPDRYERIKSIREIEKAILIAYHLNAKFVIVHGDTKNNYSIKDKAIYILESLDELVDFANNYGIILLLENLFHPRINSDPDEIYKIVEKYPSENLGICLDLGHLSIASYNYFNLSKNFLKRVRSVHLNDNINGIKDNHLLPGMGNSKGHSPEDIQYLIKNGKEIIVEACNNIKPDSNIEELIRICNNWLENYFISNN